MRLRAKTILLFASAGAKGEGEPAVKRPLDSSKRLAEIVKKLENQCLTLKKERSELEVKNERVMIELDGAKKKIAKMSAEQGTLMAEYQKLFDNT